MITWYHADRDDVKLLKALRSLVMSLSTCRDTRTEETYLRKTPDTKQAMPLGG